MVEPWADLAPAIRTVSRLVEAELMVIGAHARDAVLRELGAPTGKRTEDVDVVMVLPAGTLYRHAVASLGPPMNTLGIRFRVAGLPVDVLPAIEDAAEAARFRPAEDVTLDVRGQFEAYHCARRREVDPGLWVRVPTPEALVVLKIISWGIRGSTTTKDAQDLGLVLDALVGRLLAEDLPWAREGLLQRYDYDADAVACHLVGEAAQAALPEASAAASVIVAGRLNRLMQDMGLRDTGGRDAARLGALGAGLGTG